MLPRVLILHANGTNRDLDLEQAFILAGAECDIVHLNQLKTREKRWETYQLLAIPGGFSYADTLGAGKLFALELQHYFLDALSAFIEHGKPVIGICNGFQTLVKTGFLPGTLTFNAHGQFTCRWVTLLPQSKTCIWTREINEPILCPIAHGEGRFIGETEHAALLYTENPNGSVGDIAGICNAQGNVLGLMPHPENHIQPWQHPRWTRGEKGGLGLQIFQRGVNYARQL